MKLAIIGSRNLHNANIEAELKSIPDTIVSGGAIGVDTCAQEFAKKHGLMLIIYYPEYIRYGGRTAPLKRNELIVEECDCLLAFWDGTSRGTKYTLDYAEKLGKPIKIVKV